MMIQSKVQIEKKDLEFIKRTHKALSYKSLSEYMRVAISTKIKEDRKKLRALKRLKAMEMIGKVQQEPVFKSLDGEDFEERLVSPRSSLPGASGPPQGKQPSAIRLPTG